MVAGYDAIIQPSLCPCSSSVQDSGSDAIEIGLAGTEEMYWAVTQFGACAEENTVSHNPKNYNGMKIVKSDSTLAWRN